ncbi:MAG: hypothetical protein R3F56_19615 [Planctomycetota bacterium]
MALRTGAWSAPELDFLRRAFGQRVLADVARRLRRSEASVLARAQVMFAGRRKRRPWLAEDDERLRVGYGVVADAELALALQRTLADLRERVRLLRRQCRPRVWTSAERALLKRVYGTRSAAALEVRLGRPSKDIEAQAQRLCLRKDRRHAVRLRQSTSVPRWTAQDVARLRELYPTSDNLDVAQAIGRSVKSVANKANQLGLRKRKRWLRQAGRAAASRRWRR